VNEAIAQASERAAARPAPIPAEEAERPAWECFRADLDRYFRYARAGTLWSRTRIIVHTEGIWALGLYRASRWLHREASPPVRVGLRLPLAVVRGCMRLALGIHLDPAARIGPGLYIGHSGGIWVAPGAVIGRDCNLAQGVTLGVGGTLRRGSPRLGDRVWVGPKATLSGPLVVGSGAVIGANSLVVSNVPERGVAVGVPARVVALSGSGALIG
jgi:serine O-acetyltransferase